MRKLLFILMLLPAILFGQNKNTFKVKKQQPEIYVAAIDSNYWDNSISIQELLKAGKIQLLSNYADSARITRFTLSAGVNGNFYDWVSNNDSLTSRMRAKLIDVADGAYIIIKDIQIQTRRNQRRNINGLALKIDSKHRTVNRRLHYPILQAGICGYLKDSISKSQLLQIGKIEFLGGDSDSTKILGFDLEIPQAGAFVVYSSQTEYLTKEMISHILQLAKGSYLVFDNIRCRLSNGTIRILKELDIQVF